MTNQPQININRKKSFNNKQSGKLMFDEKNNINFSKRYRRGFNRVYQVNLSKYLTDENQDNNYIFRMPHVNDSQQQSMIIIKSKTSKIRIKRQKEETEFNNKKFYKQKFICQNEPRNGQKNQFEKQKNIGLLSNNTQQEQILDKQQNKYLQKNQSVCAYKQKIKKKKKQSNLQQQSYVYTPLYIRSQKKQITKMKKNKQLNSQQILNYKSAKGRSNHSRHEKSLNQSGHEKYYCNFKSQISCQKKINSFQCFYDKTNQNQLKNRQTTSKMSILPRINEGKQIKWNKAVLNSNSDQLKHVKSQSYAIMQMQTEKIIVGKKAFTPFQVASLTKIMTFYVILQTINLFGVNIQTEIIKVTNLIDNIQGTSAEIYSGQNYTLQQLLYGLMLPSGNDAAITLACWGGKYYTQSQNQEIKVKFFINEMNKIAKRIGLTQSKFANPHGLPHFQSRSTAFQLSKLSCICLKSQIFKKVISTKIYKGQIINQKGQKRIIQWINTHKLLRRQGFIGIKTGITVTAGPCLATAYTFKQKTYVCVILRATKVSRRFKQTRKLLAWALKKLYQRDLTQQQNERLKKLKKNRPQFDSDYSEEQSEFKYQKISATLQMKCEKAIKYFKRDFYLNLQKYQFAGDSDKINRGQQLFNKFQKNQSFRFQQLDLFFQDQVQLKFQNNVDHIEDSLMQKHLLIMIITIRNT